MKNFLKNYWTWITTFILSVIAIVITSLYAKTPEGLFFFIASAVLWFRPIIKRLSDFENSVSFLKDKNQKICALIFGIFWFLTAMITCLLSGLGLLVAEGILIVAYVVAATISEVSFGWLLYLAVLLGISYYMQESIKEENTPSQVDVIEQMYHDNSHHCVILEKEGYHTISSYDYKMLRPGDSVEIKLINNDIRQIKRY